MANETTTIPLISSEMRQIQHLIMLEAEKSTRKTIALIGSTSHKRWFEQWALKLTMAERATVLGLTIYSKADGIAVTPEMEEQLTAAHLQRIAIADEVFVLDVGGYRGAGTLAEIAYAQRLGKPVRYLSEHPDYRP